MLFDWNVKGFEPEVSSLDCVNIKLSANFGWEFWVFKEKRTSMLEPIIFHKISETQDPFRFESDLGGF